jgi:NDP-sugar pyrophosphorylase family protein
MRPYTTVLPKPLLPVGDRPILAIILQQLQDAGVTRVDLCVGYLGGLLRAYLSESTDELRAIKDLELSFHLEDRPTGTAGALHDIPNLDEPFLLLNGDVLTDLDFAGLMDAHVAADAALTVTVNQRETTIPSGVLELDGERVRAYVEKPTYSHAVSLGIYALAPRALGHLARGRVDVPDLVEALLRADELVCAHRFDGAWFDIGTLPDHERAVREFGADPSRFIRTAEDPPA